MLAEVEKLLRVQHHDQKIAAIEKELAGIPLEEEDVKEKLEDDRKAVEAAKHDFQQTEVAIKNLELDIDTRKDSIAKLKVQQFETKKNEEFRRMNGEIERYQQEITGLEDQEIELMETAETQKKALSEAKAKLAESEKDIASELEDLVDLKKNLEKQRDEEIEERKKHEEPVDEDLLDTYRRLFKAKHGMAVVGLVDEVCQGCHMKVVKSTKVAVKTEHQVTSCENCGRILYWWTDDSVGKDMGEY